MKTIELLHKMRLFLEVRSEYLEEYEMLEHLNNAQIAIVKDHIYNSNKKRSEYHQPPSAFEQTQHSSNSISSLIEDFVDGELPLLFLDKKGRLPYSEIKQHFPTNKIFGPQGQIAERKCDILHISRFQWRQDGKYRTIRWVRHNDLSQAELNPHEKPTEKYPIYTTNKDYYQVLPAIDKVVRLTIIREPLFIWNDPANANNNQDPELPDQMLHDVMYRALTMAGIQIREGEFANFIEKEEMKQ